MRLLAFVDTHEEGQWLLRLRRIVEQEKIDCIACVGDFTIFGRKTKEMLEQMAALGPPVVLIHGNHEDEDEIVPLLAKFPSLHWAHNCAVDLLGVRFIGFGGHGFRMREEDLEELEERLADKFDERTIVLSHAPPYGTTLDEVEQGWHVGNESLSDLIRRRKPLLVLCGHIHQCFHRRDTLLGTTIINPGPDGEIIEVRL
jgi:Icc-related predicted phosphoesterase